MNLKSTAPLIGFEGNYIEFGRTAYLTGWASPGTDQDRPSHRSSIGGNRRQRTFITEDHYRHYIALVSEDDRVTAKLLLDHIPD
jgi:hypothetical protein